MQPICITNPYLLRENSNFRWVLKINAYLSKFPEECKIAYRLSYKKVKMRDKRGKDIEKYPASNTLFPR